MIKRSVIVNEVVTESIAEGKYHAYIDYVLNGSHVQTKRSPDVDSKVEAELELMKLKEWFYLILEDKKEEFRKQLTIFLIIIGVLLLLGLI